MSTWSCGNGQHERPYEYTKSKKKERKVNIYKNCVATSTRAFKLPQPSPFETSFLKWGNHNYNQDNTLVKVGESSAIWWELDVPVVLLTRHALLCQPNPITTSLSAVITLHLTPDTPLPYIPVAPSLLLQLTLKDKGLLSPSDCMLLAHNRRMKTNKQKYTQKTPLAISERKMEMWRAGGHQRR